ncbi:cation:proton antiporter [Devosia sp. MSA67]|uniref:Cation:proton antiporter n=1 Tax=Devosia sediminis TaxID=2798801 RepID=A0A934MML2_9HYPH|nr:cation:proton antiporter [Devosia sediminis]
MHHETPLITTIVAGLVLAYIFGMIANRLKMPPLVGYLFAGILAGPYTPGFVADQALGAELAELGVILLMFGVGLHFSLKDLMSVRAIAIPGAVVQMGVATLLGAGLGLLLGWDLGASVLFGLALSVASTVVLLKALQDRRLIESERGRIAVGWLIVEDLAMVLALVLVPAIASLNGTSDVHDPFVSFVTRMLGMDIGIWGILGLTVLKVAAFVGFMLVVGRRVIPWALHATAHTGSRELFRLAVLAIALGVALGSAVLFGVSLALGAFFAGMILSESELSHRAANETLPLRDAFAVLFFVSVGMLFDPSILVEQPLLVLATVFIIVIGKSLAAFWIVILFRRPVGTALTISASLAQIGEFSFILASMGVALAIMPPEGQDLILAGALISIVLNPVVFFVLDLVKPRLEARIATHKGAEPKAAPIEPLEPSMAAQGPAVTDAPTQGAVDRGAPGADDDTGEPSEQTGHTVLVGYGQVGRIVAAGIKADGNGIVVIEDSDHDVAAARAEGLEVVFGNAASEDVLRLANLPAARSLLVAISNGFEAGSVCESGRKLNPGISIVARAYSEEEESFLRSCGATTVIRGEREIGKGILTYLRSDEARGVQPQEEPKLPAAENILAKAAVVAAVTEPVVSVPEPVTETLAATPLVVDEPVALVEPEPVVEPAVIEPEAAAEPESMPETPDAVLVAEPSVAVEPSADGADVTPVSAEAETETPEVAAETVEVEVETAEAPVAADVLPVVEAVPEIDTGDSAEAPVETDSLPPAEIVPIDPAPVAAEDAPAEAVEEKAEPSEDTDDTAKKDQSPGEVPVVVPEPKG